MWEGSWCSWLVCVCAHSLTRSLGTLSSYWVHWFHQHPELHATAAEELSSRWWSLNTSTCFLMTSPMSSNVRNEWDREGWGRGLDTHSPWYSNGIHRQRCVQEPLRPTQNHRILIYVQTGPPEDSQDYPWEQLRISLQKRYFSPWKPAFMPSDTPIQGFLSRTIPTPQIT